QYGEADSLADLADALLCLDEADNAIARLRESLAIRREIGDVHGEAVTLRLLGLALARAGATQRARAQLAPASRLSEELGDQAQGREAGPALAALTGLDLSAG